MTLDGKTNRCNELEKEVNKLTSKHEDVMRELLAEKVIKMSKNAWYCPIKWFYN